MDKALALLSERLRSEIDSHIDRLLDSGDTQVFRELMARSIVRHQAASFLLGQDSKILTLADQRIITDANKFQLRYLDSFVEQIAAGDYENLERQLRARAALYTGATKIPYFQGQNKGVPLPYWPTETICRANCGCAWDVTKLAGVGNWDAMWIKEKNDSCQTCIERQGRNPHRIRAYELQ